MQADSGSATSSLIDFLDRADDHGAVRRFARRAHNFLVVAVPDQNQRAAFARKLQSFQVNFGDQAGR